MASKTNSTEVIIDGKMLTLTGTESEEYLQKVASYLNHKMASCEESEGYRKQSPEMRNVLLALNLADDYFKARKRAESMEVEMGARDKEVYDLKHDLIATQIKYENTQKALDKAREENQALQMEIVKLETQAQVEKK